MPGFFVNGLREMGRKSGRFGLRRRLAAQDSKRRDALAALGRVAWQSGTDLTPFSGQREQLLRLDARAGELSATSARLEQERAELEARRQAEVARFEGLLQPARARQASADAALKAARAALADQKTTDAAARQPLAAEAASKADESAKAAGEVTRLETEKKAALAPIDAALKRVRQESSGATRESAAVGRERTDRFRDLGLALYDARATEPELASPIEAVAVIDRDRAATAQAIDSSLAITAAMPRGTMGKFWTVAFVLPAACLAVAYLAYSRLATQAPDEAVATAASAAPSTGVSPVYAEQLRKDDAVKAFLASKGASGRDDAVRILEADLMEMGSSADRANLPLLETVLRRGEPELRAAAAHAIGMIGPTAAELPLLVDALNDPAPSVRDAVASALDQIDESAAKLLVRRARHGAPERMRSRAEGLAPTELPAAASLGMPVYPGATFLRFASNLGVGRVAFTTSDSPDKVRQFFESAAGRPALGGEEFSRLYLGGSPGDPSGSERLGRELEAWVRDAVKAGRSPADLEKEMTRRTAQAGELPLVRYADASLFASPVFVAFGAPPSGDAPVGIGYVAVFEDRALGKTGFELHVPQK